MALALRPLVATQIELRTACLLAARPVQEFNRQLISNDGRQILSVVDHFMKCRLFAKIGQSESVAIQICRPKWPVEIDRQQSQW